MSLALSVVIPVHNEASLVPELARRVVAATERASQDFEVLFVDDGSTDGTGDLPLPLGARWHRLPANRGQLAATQAGLQQASGRFVIVLDGDLQDPPEPIPDLFAAARRAVGHDAVLMTKTTRSASLPFLVARRAYDLLQQAPGAHPLPPGAGSYLCMRQALAHRVSKLDLVDGNLAAVVVGLGARVRTLPYAKLRRGAGDSRVGSWGLIREGLFSLLWTGAASAWCFLIGLVAVAWGVRSRKPRALLAGIAALSAAAAVEGLRRDGLEEGEPQR